MIDLKKNIDIFKIYTSNILSKAEKIFWLLTKKGLCASCNHYDDNIKENADKFLI